MVVGGGFIGIEVAENLRELGIDVTLVEAADQLMAPFDRDMASFIHAEIRKNGIHLMLDTMVEGFADTDCGIDVKLKSVSDTSYRYGCNGNRRRSRNHTCER